MIVTGHVDKIAFVSFVGRYQKEAETIVNMGIFPVWKAYRICKLSLYPHYPQPLLSLLFFLLRLLKKKPLPSLTDDGYRTEEISCRFDFHYMYN